MADSRPVDLAPCDAPVAREESLDTSLERISIYVMEDTESINRLNVKGKEMKARMKAALVRTRLIQGVFIGLKCKAKAEKFLPDGY